MTNQLPSAKRLLPCVLIVFLLIGKPGVAQQELTKINGWNAYVHLPDDYNSTSKTYPVIIFLPGIGEVGNNPAGLLVFGPSRFVALGDKMQFNVNGVIEKPIVISMQPPNAWPSPVALNRQLDSIVKRWRVNVNRISFTGLSMGGSSWDNYINTSPVYALRPASVVAMSAPPPANPLLTNFALYAATGGKWWGFEGTQDGRYMWRIRDIMNLTSAGSARYTHYNGGHCCWNNWYDPAYREQGENIYEWMLKQVRNPVLTPNVAPVAAAGDDQVITLPVNSVQLNGVATDNDGTITSVSWTKISGPSAFALVNSSASSATANNLVAGVYQFRFSVTDNAGGEDADTISITVKPAQQPPVNVPPVAIAGNDLSITLPDNSVTLDGSATDQDGGVTTYSWTKISGPSTFNLAAPSAARTSVSALAEGIYLFRLQVTDDAGATGADTVKITVNPAPPPPNVLPVASAGPDQAITLPVNSVTLTGSGTDSDGNVTSYSWTKISGPGRFTFANANTGTTLVSDLVAGTYRFRLQVRDNDGGVHADTTSVVVSPGAIPPPVNQGPSANAGPDQEVEQGDVTLTGSGSDEDGTIESYQWTKIAGPDPASIVNSNAPVTGVSNLSPGEYTFRLLVTDDDGATASDVIIVRVTPPVPPPNIPPVADAGSDLVITLPVNNVVVTGTGTDADGVVVSSNWKKVSGPAAFRLTTLGSGQVSIDDLEEGVYEFRLEVLDDDGATGTSSLKVTVLRKPNEPPVAFARGEKEVNMLSNSTVLQGTAVDADGYIDSKVWKQLSGPTSSRLLTPALFETEVREFTSGDYVFEFEVTDNEGAKARDTVGITVKGINAGSVLLYPNPASGNETVTLTISGHTTANLSPITILDMSGRVVYQEQFMRSQAIVSRKLNVAALQPGIYIVEVGLDLNTRVSCRLVKR